ncbi:MAG: restriction endonuclease subunit R [Puniceicoccaceae bacterium]|nr:MAG: restriction endonuclease subunit R [Puniceicoccaceae bacterium]
MQLKDYQTELLDNFEAFLDDCRIEGDPAKAFAQSTKAWLGFAAPYRPLPASEYNPKAGETPFVCLRVPTGGGKTFLAAHAIQRVTRSYLPSNYALTLWLVPTESIRSQTLRVLKDRASPAHQSIRREMGEFTVMEVAEALYMQPSTLETGHVIIVATMQSFKREDTSGLTAYKENGHLMPHFRGITDKATVGNHSLVDVFRLRRPFIVVDEAHNEGTALAIDTLSNFCPSAVLELTATPDRKHAPSNVLRSISASTLQSYDMLKLPLELAVHEDWQVVLRDALARRDQLEKDAEAERKQTGEAIRPVLFIQADKESQTHDTFTPGVVKQRLVHDFGKAEADIAIVTGKKDELGARQVGDPDFPRIIITVDKLREGWDCPVAYVLMTFRNSTSATAVEQVVGRVLRMPSVMRKQHETLNRAYAYACSNQFGEIVQSLRDGLVQNGFEKMDAKDLIIAPTQHEDDLFTQFEETVLQLPEDEDGIISPPDLSVFSAADLKKIDVTPEAGRMTVQGTVTPALRKKLLSAFKDENHKSAIDQALTIQAERQAPERPISPSRRGETFCVPQLLIQQGDFLAVFDETTLIEGDWELESFDPVLSEQEFPTNQEAIQRARFGISEKEKVDVRAYDELEAQLGLLNDEGGWDLLSLTSWLDSNTPFLYASRDEKVAWVRRVLEELIKTRGLTIATLAYRKFRLRKAIEKKLQSGLQRVQQAAFKEILAHESNHSNQLAREGNDLNSIVTAPDTNAIRFKEGHYAYDDPYCGFFQFRKHFFGVIGNLKSQGEEFECAVQLDQMPEVDYWVRNVEKKPGAFWLPTSRYRFYPDFVAKLKDGRILVVEYKGSKLAEAASEVEKNDIGQLWASRSENCLFVMVVDRNWQSIRDAI